MLKCSSAVAEAEFRKAIGPGHFPDCTINNARRRINHCESQGHQFRPRYRSRRKATSRPSVTCHQPLPLGLLPYLFSIVAEGNTVAVDVRAQTRIGRASRRGHLRSKARPGSGAIALLCHLLERGNLSEKVFNWLRRAAKHCRAWSDIRNDASLRPDLCALSNPKMSGHGRLPPDPDEILKHG